MSDGRESGGEGNAIPVSAGRGVKLETYGKEIVEKGVKLSGNSGRVYLPLVWVGCRVKIVRLD
jgi:hypothetical protein